MALIGDLTTVAQLIAKISDAVSTARDLPRVCWRFAVHLQDIGRHLEPLRGAQLDKATQQTLANLQRTLEWSYDVIVNCSRRSYAYRLIKGKSIRDKIREAQDEIDRILRLFPLIQLSQDYGYRVWIIVVVCCSFIYYSYAASTLTLINLLSADHLSLVLLLYVFFFLEE